MKPIVPPALGYPGSGDAPEYSATSTPFGITTALAPRCSTWTCLASSLTAIRPVIFSRNGCSMPWKVANILDRGFAVWKVATIGPSATIRASMDRLGATGSCR